MAKTRRQAGNITLKKEEEEDCKPILLLNGVSNTKSNNKITKRKTPKSKNRRSPAPQVKMEDDTDTKSLLKSTPNSSNSVSRPRVSQEQINQLIHYIANDKMSITQAARKLNISQSTGIRYYNVYKNDPERGIPVPLNHNPKTCTQEQIENLIRYVNQDKMSVAQASAKANMSDSSARYYYNRYLRDPNHNVQQLKRSYTQDQRETFVGYIINDKMSIKAAAKKANMKIGTAKGYYIEYFKIQNPGIARPSHIVTPRCFTQEQIKELISYIVNDKISIAAASRKANINDESARRYYRQYLQDNNIEPPVPRHCKHYTQDDINKFIRYIVNDKMNIAAASKKAKMNTGSAQKYYHNYFKVQNPDTPAPSHIVTHKRSTQEQLKEAMGYIINDKMSIATASRKANVCHATTRVRYRQYLKDHNMKLPVKRVVRRYTQDQINEFLRYIVDGKMSIKTASEKANMSNETGRIYYHQYLKDRNIDGPLKNAMTQEQKSELIRYIVDDKMSVTAAAKKVNVPYSTAYKYYQQYIEDNNLPLAVAVRYTQDQKSRLIRYIVDDKMSLKAASKKVNMTYVTGLCYYNRYLNSKKPDLPAPRLRSAHVPDPPVRRLQAVYVRNRKLLDFI